ncbi:hypothetical protein M0R45_020333 [Rubus argutus]|uniref:Uncharacterized protein n=1 Tax=Rubus argutus TaxID=59490 RepID=A0AAW1X8L3_RUBAR
MGSNSITVFLVATFWCGYVGCKASQVRLSRLQLTLSVQFHQLNQHHIEGYGKEGDDLRQKLSMRVLRCHPMYCRSSTRMRADCSSPCFSSTGSEVPFCTLAWRLNVANMKLPQRLRDDIVPPQSPLVAIVNGEAPTANEVANTLKQVAKSAAGM